MSQFTTADPRVNGRLYRSIDAPGLPGVPRQYLRTSWVTSVANLDGLRTYQIWEGDHFGANGAPVPGATTTSYRKAHRVARVLVGTPTHHPAWTRPLPKTLARRR